jgi:hypothetical protein
MKAPFIRSLGPSGLLLALSAMSASAQRPVELGVDLGFSYTTQSPHVSTFSIPIGDVRAGFFVSDRLSFEPRISLAYVKVEDVDATTLFAGTAGLLYHFSADRSRSQVFVRPFVEWQHIDIGPASASQFFAGGTVGVKLPAGSRLATRLEVGYSHGFENDDFASSDQILASFGISFFTR